ncbi:uncharacterized protein [Coffea arabica]|uniref:Protein BIC1-like n=1 Tax=Coffea arabica TaxID=13443 RepID=A0A6P6VQ99_COFAR
MANCSSSIAADTKTTNMAADHLSKTSKTSKAHEGSSDFDNYRPVIASPRVRCQDAKANGTSSSSVQQDALQPMPKSPIQQEESGREKLFRHWNEVAGRVCIPEIWGQEASLNDWMDCSLFDSLLAPKGAVSAREALIAERKRDSTRHLMKMETGGNNSSVRQGSGRSGDPKPSIDAYIKY